MVMQPLLLLLLCHITLAAVPLGEFVPFGPGNGDHNATAGDDLSILLNLKYDIPFFGVPYQQLWLNYNGGISSKGGLVSYTPDCDPVASSMQMIMAFWADIMTYSNDVGMLYYRETQNPAVLGKIAGEIVAAYPALWDLRLSNAIIATWFNVSFYGVGSCYSDHSLWPRNTFQAILATDQSRTFAIFYYNSIVWTTGRASQSGGNCLGIGGHPARIGFDAGDGKTLEKLPDSCTPDIVKVAEKSNVGVPGRFVFRIDGSDIDIGNCNDTKYKTEKLIVNPKWVDTWGHVPLSLQGPCMNESFTLTCVFNDVQAGVIEVPASYNGVSGAATCQVPYLYGIGRSKVGLKVVYDGQVDIYEGLLYVVDPYPTLNVTEVDDTRLKISWDPDNFPNVTGVSVLMLKYGTQSNGKEEWFEDTASVQKVPNNGVLVVQRPQFTEPSGMIYAFTVQPEIKERVGPIAIGIGTAIAAVVAVPLYIYTHQESLCNKWHDTDPGPPKGLPPCPPTLAQAEIDPNFELDPQTEEMVNFFHPGGYKSYRSTTATSTGAGQQCVYDKSGNNMVGPPGGGTADAAGPGNYLQRLKHLMKDVLPWVYCCLHQPKAQCQKYYDKRPSDSGSNYVPPRLGRGNGDPHIVTLDGSEYTFNGAGEFWMLKNSLATSKTLLMQSRTEIFGSSKATVFTSFAFFVQPSGPKIQISLTGAKRLGVLLDEYSLEMNDRQLWSQSFNGVTISRNEDFSSVIVTFAVGFNFVITADHSALNFVASAKVENFGKVEGLLGYFDGDKLNDLKTPDGQVIPIGSNLSQIHYGFGQKWAITEADSLFVYSEGQNFATFSNPTFIPNLIDPNPSELPQEVRDTCGNSSECFYDYVATGDISFANSTKMSVDSFNQSVQQIQEAEVVVCPTIPTDLNTFINATKFTVGGEVSFSCNDGYHLVGIAQIKCETNGKWSSQPPICAIDTTTSTTTPTTTTSKGATNTAFSILIISICSWAIQVINI